MTTEPAASKRSRQILLIGALLGVSLCGFMPAHSTGSAFDYRAIQKLIADGRADAAIERIDLELAKDPDGWSANALRADALVALGKPSEAEAGLVRWADRDPSDPHPVEQLLRFYGRAGRFESLALMTPRICALPEPARRDELLTAIDTLCAASRCRLAEEPLRRLMPEASDAASAAIIDTLDDASKGNIPHMLAELNRILRKPEESAVRAEALVVVSLRAASANQAGTSKTGVAEDLPPTGLEDPSRLAVLPRRIGQVDLKYPGVARRARIEGKVILRTAILATGECVVTGLITASNPMFVPNAAEALARARYEPGRNQSGQVVASDFVVRLDFRLK